MFALMNVSGSGRESAIRRVIDSKAIAQSRPYSRNARRRILPTGVFGSSVRNSMYFGRL